MILNMAVDNGGINGGHVISLLNSSNAATTTTTTTTINQHESHSFNFLKRKHDVAVDNCSNATDIHQEINNQNEIVAEHLAAQYQGTEDLGDDTAWKKRHIELPAVTTIATTITNNTDATTNLNAMTTATNCFNLNNDLNLYSESNNNNSHNNNNNNIIEINNNNNNNNDVTFNLITSSAFINDLFDYDAGLLVPVATAATTSSNQQQHSQLITTISNNNKSNSNNINIIASNIQPTNVYIDSEEWQSQDLLELDHRYNSGLQTEISQLTPTLNLNATHSNNQQMLPAPSMNAPQHQLQNSNTTADNFLVPQKQIAEHLPAASSIPLAKYRSVQNLTQLESPQNSPTLQKPEADSDFEDKNLSWLLNFKFDDLPHLSPDISANSHGNANTIASHSKTGNAFPNSTANSNGASANPRDRSRSPKTSSSTKTGKKFEELVMEVTSELDVNDMTIAENVVVEDTPYKTIKKPPFTYTELIEYALEDKGELTVSGIYQWISDRFPYYKSNDDRWKNSVRHNLSINPHFRKGVKAPQGAGHLWTISSGDSAENVLAWEHKKQRLELFFKMESMNRERLQQHQQQQLQNQQLQQQRNEQCPSPHNHQGCQADQCLYDEAAKAAATISQEMLQQQQQQTNTNQHADEASISHNNNNNNGSNSQQHQRHVTQIMHELPFNDLMTDEELRKTAGQILNGIHREVEVQSVNSIISTYHDVLLDNEDYLNPIQKDVAVHESGLRHSNAHHHTTNNNSQHSNQNASQYYVTEIDPMELGIQMSHQVHEEEEVLFSDDFNLNYFAYNAANDIVA